MANTSRRYIDKNGKMFIPMNVEGGNWDEHFITTPKLVCIVGMLSVALIIGLSLSDSGAPLTSYLLSYLVWGIACFYITRFYIFEEKFYYRMYKQLKESEITTPAIFWDIASIRDTPNGAVLTYSDARLGVMVRLERDTITGKHPEFKETHYDAISDFYKQIMLKKFNFVQLNIMEQAGNDPRLEELDKLIHSSDNPNIQMLMEKQIGYIKNVTHHTLYESDYFLFYTNDLTKLETIVDEVIDIVYTILDGAYIGYRVLTARDIIEFVKEEYGVKYFNYTDATLTMFKNQGVHTKNPFEISEIVYADGDRQKIVSTDMIRINKLTSDILNGVVDLNSISLKDTLYPKIQQNKNKVEFSSLSQGFEVKEPVQNKHIKQTTKHGIGFKPLLHKQEESSPEQIEEYVDPRTQPLGKQPMQQASIRQTRNDVNNQVQRPMQPQRPINTSSTQPAQPQFGRAPIPNKMSQINLDKQHQAPRPFSQNNTIPTHQTEQTKQSDVFDTDFDDGFDFEGTPNQFNQPNDDDIIDI